MWIAIYDGLFEHHVRPFVELSFMPKGLAADPNDLHVFWYHPNVSPPKDYCAVGRDDDGFCEAPGSRAVRD